MRSAAPAILLAGCAGAPAVVEGDDRPVWPDVRLEGTGQDDNQESPPPTPAPTPVPGPTGCDRLTLPGDLAAEADEYPFRPLPIDRRPAVVHQMFNGPEWAPNIRRQLNDSADVDPADGIPDGFNRLLEYLDELYDEGWRRIVLNRAAGGIGLNFADMTRHQQEGYLRHVRAWADAHRDCSLEVYIRMNAPYERDFNNRDGVCAMQKVLAPWLAAGMSVAWLDAITTGSNPGDWVIVEQLNRSPDLYDASMRRRLVVGAESVVWDPRAAGRPLAIDKVPWVAANQNPVWSVIDLPNRSFDPRTTAVNYWVTNFGEGRGYPLDSIGRLADWKDKGLVLWYFWAPDFNQRDWFKRIYQFGTIERPADFDADGELTTSDIDQFMARWRDDSSPITWVNGDYNLDGRRDQADVRAFRADFDRGGGRPISFGPSR